MATRPDITASRRGVERRGWRRGSTFVPLALIVVTFMAIAAVAIDLGMSSLTRNLLQTAVEHSALEGARWKDALPDQERRILASQAVALVFDDDLNIDDLDEPHALGAGPLFRVTGGTGDLDALGLIELGDPSLPRGGNVYREREAFAPGVNIWLALNEANLPHGDMLSGVYDPAASNLDGRFMGGAWLPYDREDLTPDADGSAFLVRMRRTNNFQNLDRLPDISTSGPAIPYLFGRGSMLPGADPGATYSPRHHGMTVRATAIADARPAKTIGAPGYTDPLLAGALIPGAAPFALALDYWNTLVVHTPPAFPPVLTVDLATGEVEDLTGPVGVLTRVATLNAAIDNSQTSITVSTNAGFPTDATPFRVRVEGEILTVTAVAGTTWTVVRGAEDTPAAPHAQDTAVALLASMTIGRPLSVVRSAPVGLSPVQGATRNVLVPLYATVNVGGSDIDLIVGFGLAEIQPGVPNPDPLDPALAFELRKAAATVLPRNTGATLAGAWFSEVEDVLGPLDPADIEELLNGDGTPLNPGLLGWHAQVDQSALAPALVRAYGP